MKFRLNQVIAGGLLSGCLVLIYQMSYPMRFDFEAEYKKTIVNFTKESVRWNIYRKPIDNCDLSKCDFETLESKYLDSIRVLPNSNVGTHEERINQNLIYSSRFNLNSEYISDDLTFGGTKVFAKNISIFVNNKTAFRGAKLPRNGVLLREFLHPGENKIVVVLDPTGFPEPGFQINSDIIIAPQKVVSKIVKGHVRKFEYLKNWLVIPRLFLLTFFCLSMLFFHKYKASLFFVAFVFMSIINTMFTFNLWFGTKMSSTITWLGMNISEVIAQLLFLSIIYNFFNLKWLMFHRALLTFGCAFCGIVAFSYGELPLNKIIEFSFYSGKIIQVIAIGLILFCCAKFYLQIAVGKTHKILHKYLAFFSATCCLVSLAFLGRSLLFFDNAWLVPNFVNLGFTFLFGVFFVVDRTQDTSKRFLLEAKLSQILDKTKLKQIMETKGLHQVESKEITVMFLDIRSFSKMSESLKDSEIVTALNTYMDIVSKIVNSHDGVIDKFVGDGIIATWGIAGTSSNPDLAVKAAIEIRNSFVEPIRLNNSGHSVVLKIGVGIHYGSAIIGPIGSSKRIDYTVVGPTLNEASRIEELSKLYSNNILISGIVFDQVKENVKACRIGVSKLRGTSKEVELYALKHRIEAGVIQSYNSDFSDLVEKAA